VSDSATRHIAEVPTREGWGRDGSSFHDVYDVIVVVCFLALIALVVFGGAVMFLSRVTAALPVSPRTACAVLDGCVVAGPDANKAVVVDENPTEGPMLTR
jgi:hypothetical protein